MIPSPQKRITGVFFLALLSALPVLRAQESGRSLYFDGSSSGPIVIVPFHPSQNLYQQTSQLTYELWVKPDSSGVGGALINKAIGACKDNWCLGGGLEDLAFLTGNSCSGDEAGVAGPGLRAGIWQHVAGVWDGRNVRLYVNGELTASRAYAGNPAADDIAMSIGANNHWNSDYRSFAGWIDEVRYSSVARYHGPFRPRTRHEPDEHTVFLFHLDEGEGALTADASRAMLLAEIKGAVWSDDSPRKSRMPNQRDEHTLLLVTFDDAVNDGRAVGVSGAAHEIQRSPVHEVLVPEGNYDAFTAECWVLMKDSLYGEEIPLLGQHLGSRSEWKLSVGANRQIVFSLHSGQSSGDTVSTIRSTASLTPGAWAHIAGSWSRASSVQVLHVNGIAVGSTYAVRSAGLHGGTMLSIGGRPVKQRGSVLIDEVRLSSRARISFEYGLQLPPIELTAADEDGAVRLRWRNTGAPEALVHNIIWRGLNPREMATVATTESNSYLDVAIGGQERYFYRVSALDRSGFETLPSKIVEVVMERGSGGGIRQFLLVGGAVFLATGLAVTVWYFLRRRRSAVQGLPLPVWSQADEQRVRSEIRLFGRFKVCDRGGQDITVSATPQIKQLLLLLILNSCGGKNGGRGIESERISGVLWPDADRGRGKNSRNVAIRRLRDFLALVGDVEIVQESSLWRIEVGRTARCDYLEFREIHDLLKTGGGRGQRGLILKWSEILASGTFLEDASYDWLDPIRAELISSVVRIGMGVLADPAVQSDHQVLLNVCSAILAVDPMVSDAVRMKMRIHIEEGQHGLAVQAFEAFRREYRSVFAKEYERSYEDFLAHFRV